MKNNKTKSALKHAYIISTIALKTIVGTLSVGCSDNGNGNGNGGNGGNGNDPFRDFKVAFDNLPVVVGYAIGNNPDNSYKYDDTVSTNGKILTKDGGFAWRGDTVVQELDGKRNFFVAGTRIPTNHPSGDHLFSLSGGVAAPGYEGQLASGRIVSLSVTR